MHQILTLEEIDPVGAKCMPVRAADLVLYMRVTIGGIVYEIDRLKEQFELR